MSYLQALFLGIIQGLTEFLPVSSSGHLNFFRYALDIILQENTILFDLFCHVATVLAVCFFLGKSMFNSAKNYRWPLLIFVSLLPLLPAALFKKSLEAIYTQPSNLYFFYLITAAVLIFGYAKTRLQSFKVLSIDQVSIYHALIIGSAQACAILPGISRSGMTICFALFCGITPKLALNYSLLLSIPTILGVTSVQVLELALDKPEMLQNLYALSTPILLAFSSAFIFGYIALYLLRWSLYSCRFHLYACYCLAFSLLCYYLINLA